MFMDVNEIDSPASPALLFKNYMSMEESCLRTGYGVCSLGITLVLGLYKAVSEDSTSFRFTICLKGSLPMTVRFLY